MSMNGMEYEIRRDELYFYVVAKTDLKNIH